MTRTVWLIVTLLGIVNCLGQPKEDVPLQTEWMAGSGQWSDVSRWSHGLPDGYRSASIRGNSQVVISRGTYLAGELRVGTNSGDRTRVEVDGGELVLMQDSLFLGEYSGGEAEVVLKRGAIHSVMDVFVGAASELSKRANKASLAIQGGSFLGRTLTVGLGFGAEAKLSIEGSGASAVHVLDYVQMHAHAEENGKAGRSTLAFALDRHGVTPITIQSRARGLEIEHDAPSECRLRITLMEAPPRDDITLLTAHAATRGTFDDLPEGSEITAQYGGRTYRWRLTYRGGTEGHDLLLKNQNEPMSGQVETHARPMPQIPEPLWRTHQLFPLTAMTGEPAFEGAEGFGAFTPGGRGGKVVYVENLNDAGPGSFRAALEMTGPRKVLFKVGGEIALKSPIIIQQPFVTIDGQHATGEGITLKNYGIEVRTHDVVLRYFRIRIGDGDVRPGESMAKYEGADGIYALYFTEGSTNCIADHLSLSWSTNKVLSTTKMSDLITIQYCILSESLNFAGHGYASITGGNRVSWHHNLFAHHVSRTVRFQGAVDADFRNNVIYDWGHTAAYGEFDRLNYVGNYLKPGPSTTQKPRLFHNGVAVVAAGSAFVADNVMEGEDRVNQDNWRGMGYYYFDRARVGAAKPFLSPRVTTESAAAAYEHVLKDAGVTRPQRDAVDARVVREVRDGRGRIINWVREAGN